MKYLYYKLNELKEPKKKYSLDSKYVSVFWKPTFCSIVPSCIGYKPFAVWWLFHLFRVFYNRDYTLFLIYDGDRLIHRTCVFPGYFRFPFMEKRDLQIGDTWTDPDYRGQGLAPYGIQAVSEKYLSGDKRAIWYVVADDNTPSIRAIEKCGYLYIGSGSRKNRFGLGPLGYYDIDPN